MEKSPQMEAILRAFSGFLAQQSFFDILWSEKAGYIKILTECPEAEGVVVLDTPEKLLDILYTGIAEAVSCDRHGSRYDPYEQGLEPEDQAAYRRWVSAMLGSADDVRESCLDYLERFLPTCFQ